MTITRVPSLAHWSAFNALVEDGRVVGCEPFARDPAPSPMLKAIPEMWLRRTKQAGIRFAVVSPAQVRRARKPDIDLDGMTLIGR